MKFETTKVGFVPFKFTIEVESAAEAQHIYDILNRYHDVSQRDCPICPLTRAFREAAGL